MAKKNEAPQGHVLPRRTDQPFENDEFNVVFWFQGVSQVV